MDRESPRIDGDHIESKEETRVEDDEPLVFEGLTLRHSPQLGRRFIEWLSDRRE